VIANITHTMGDLILFPVYAGSFLNIIALNCDISVFCHITVVKVKMLSLNEHGV
jgi:hypothetical protein